MTSTDPATYGYDVLLADLNKEFRTLKTHDINWRKKQLRGMLKMVQDNHELIAEAVLTDIPNPKMRAVADYTFVGSLKLSLDQLDKWAKPVSVTRANFDGSAQYLNVPKGVVLILSPFNFPFELAMGPLVSAIAAGNCAIVKPSELTPCTSALIAKLLPQYVDSSCVKVVEGGIPETTALLKMKFNHIVYTGSSMVGRIVMEAASKHLTPVTLELGGKNAAILDASANLAVCAERIAVFKGFNMGQICLASDYLLVQDTVAEEFTKLLLEKFKEFFDGDQKERRNVGRIVNPRHAERIKKLLDSTTGEIIFGGECDVDNAHVDLTVVKNPSLNDEIMKEEVFGPLLSLYTYSTIEEACEIANNQSRESLSLMIFSSNQANIDKIINNTVSGNVLVNAIAETYSNPLLPFGGIGESGMGYLNGEHGFHALSHKRAVVYRDTFLSQMTKLSGNFPDKAYDIVVKMNVTGFISDAQMTAAKVVVVGGVAIVGAAVFNKSFL